MVVRREVWVALALIASPHGQRILWFGPWGRRTFETWLAGPPPHWFPFGSIHSWVIFYFSRDGYAGNFRIFWPIWVRGWYAHGHRPGVVPRTGGASWRCQDARTGEL